MKRLFALLLALTMVFALAACGDNEKKPSPSGGGTTDPGTSQQDSQTDKMSWPSADFITSGMKYTGGGMITYVDYIDGATQADGTIFF